jgi:hypothetical protein
LIVSSIIAFCRFFCPVGLNILSKKENESYCLKAVFWCGWAWGVFKGVFLPVFSVFCGVVVCVRLSQNVYSATSLKPLIDDKLPKPLNMQTPFYI